MPTRSSRLLMAATLALTQVVVGCTGARHLTEGHLAYNEAVRMASDQELLLNIVRLRYLDSLEFLSISSINSTVSFSIQIDAGAGRSGGASNVNADAGVGYSSTPTFSFVPQRGGKFASRLTEPVDLDTLVIIAAANRDAHRIFGLLVTWMNGLDNQEGEIDPRFVKATETLTRLQFAGDALFGFREEEVEVTPPLSADQVSPSTMLQAINAGLGVRRLPDSNEITFTRTRRVPTLYVSSEANDRSALLEQLGLDASQTDFPVREGAGGFVTADKGELSIRTRSLLHGMAFLSQGVEVPSEHLASGVASQAWPHPSVDAVSMDEIFRVHQSKRKPREASLAVLHRGNWFYVRDDDAATKRTFFLITQAFRLAFAAETGGAPVLTLPVGG